MRLAVLGAGFIGLNTIRLALGRGDEVTVLDHKPRAADVPDNVTWRVGDFADERDVASTIEGADAIYHFISSTVPGDEVNIASELQQNVFQTLQLLNLSVKQKVRRLVFVSSSSVYGVQRSLPIPETAATDPISAHGVHKLAIEKYLQLYSYLHGLDCKIVRLSNPYGPGQKLHGRQGFIAIAIGRILKGEEIVIRGDGSTIRDFVFIDDVCETLYAAATIPSSDVLFNVGSGEGRSLNEVVSALESLLERRLPLRYIESRNLDIPESVLDISRVRAVFGIWPRTPLKEGLRTTLRYHGVVL